MASDPIVWAIIGIILLVIEAFVMQGMGILFAGFAAICVGVSIYNDPENLMGAIGSQLVYFFGYTAFWATILWMPLKHFFGYASEDEYKNIIGTFGIVFETFKKGDIGKLSWSGTLVRCKIDPQSQADELTVKTNVKVTNVVDGIYHVKPVREEMDNFKDRDTILREQEEAKARAEEEARAAEMAANPMSDLKKED